MPKNNPNIIECPNCGGEGQEYCKKCAGNKKALVICTQCEGRGCKACGTDGFIEDTCPECRGSGRSKETCKVCKGSGEIDQSKL